MIRCYSGFTVVTRFKSDDKSVWCIISELTSMLASLVSSMMKVAAVRRRLYFFIKFFVDLNRNHQKCEKNVYVKIYLTEG